MKYLLLSLTLITPTAFAQDVVNVTHFDDWSITSYSDHDYHFLHTKTSEYQYKQVQLTCGGEIDFETEDEVTLGRGFSIDGTDIYAFGDLEVSSHMSGEEDGAILAQLKAGRTLTLHELTFYGYGTNDYSLIGFTTAYDEFMWLCDAKEGDDEHVRLQRISDIIQEAVKTMTIGQAQEFYSSQEGLSEEELDEYLEDYANTYEEWKNMDRTGEHPGCAVDAPLDTPC